MDQDNRWEKFKTGIIGNLGFIVVAGLIAVNIARNFVNITNTGKTISEIIADGLFALFFSWIIRSLLSYQGTLSGRKDKRMLSTLECYATAITKMEPYSPLLESFCEMKNAQQRIKQRRKILSRKHIEYEDVFTEDPTRINEVIKKRLQALENLENSIDLQDMSSSKRKRVLKRKLKRERREIFQCIKKANNLTLSDLTEEKLTTDGVNSDDPYKFAMPLGRWVARKGALSLPFSIVCAVVLGYYGFSLIKDPSIATVIGALIQVGIYLAFGAWQFIVSYIHTTDTYRKSVTQKINILNEFIVLAADRQGVKFAPPVEIIKIEKKAAPVTAPEVVAVGVQNKEEAAAPVKDPFAEAAAPQEVSEEQTDNKGKEVIVYGEQDKPIELGQPAELLGD